MRIGDLIRTIVSRASSQNQAAKKSGVAQSTLSEWQSGKVSPGLEKYIELCRALGCRPGVELDNFLGLGGAKPQTAEDVLGTALGLKVSEQLKLISLISAKLTEYQGAQEMIDSRCLADLITKYLEDEQITPEKFINMSGITQPQYWNITHGLLMGSVGEIEVQLSLISSIIRNPATKKPFDSREEMIEYCSTRKLLDSQQLEPNGTNRR